MPFPLLIRLSLPTTLPHDGEFPFQLSVHLSLLWNPGWFPGEVKSSSPSLVTPHLTALLKVSLCACGYDYWVVNLQLRLAL